MPRTCTICRHEKRREIDKALVLAAEPFRVIARHYAVSEDALQRHKKVHLSATVVRSGMRREERRVGSLLEQVETLATRTQALLDESFPEQRTARGRSIPGTWLPWSGRCGKPSNSWLN